MTTTHQDEQRERRETLENDRRVQKAEHDRRNASTYATFAEAFADEDRQGRFKAVNKTTVVGTDAIAKYPEQPPNSPFHHDRVPDEPPLGFSVEDHEPVGTAKEIQASLESQPTDDNEPPRAA
jgi:hypothetical protein